MTYEVSGTAVIPTVTYGNIQPAFTAHGETLEEASNNWLKQMWRFHRMLGKPFEVNPNFDAPAGKVLRCWASGTEVVFDQASHKYRTGDNRPWHSGSAFAEKYVSDFDGPVIAAKSAAKYGVEAADLLDMWELNAEVSRLVGSAVHAALQLRGECAELSRRTKDGALDAALTKNPILRPIVEAFFAGREDEEAHFEVFVADPVLHHCGQIDRLVVEPDGVVVEDFKTNADLKKRETIKAPFKGKVEATLLGSYWLQLSFYARILQSHGVNVKGLRVHHWTGVEWKTYTHGVVNIQEEIQ